MSKTYVGVCKGCRGWVAAIVDHPCFTRNEMAKTVAGFIKDGYEVISVDSEEVRVILHGCTCKPKQGELL